MLVRAATLLVWALLGASVVAWGLTLFVRGQPLPPAAAVGAPGGQAASAIAATDWQRLLGVDAAVAAPEPEAQSAEPGLEQRLRLIGVAGPRAAQPRTREGVALIAVDGEAPRAFRVGQVVQGRHVLQQVAANTVEIGPPGLPAAARLELPPLPPAATGTLPAAVSNAAPNQPPAPLSSPPSAQMPPGAPQRLALPPQRGDANSPATPRTMQ
jgi:general secretion pathway protein C